MTYVERERFEPPEHGLQSEERVIWHEKAGTPFLTIFCGGCLPLSSVFIIPISAVILGERVGFGIAFLLLAGILYYLVKFITIKRTSYYLTNQRIIEVRGGEIIEEIPRSVFTGKKPNEFLRISEDHEDAYTWYNILIYDIDTKKMIKLHCVDEEVLESLRALSEMEK
ncbi:MAG: hypothetical protein BAJATHORv1_20131 [Candidatus Thorarchaeota archaeon]|nr:MAG: hypothetical protein BAJATHORv1_20131 [Candidatus Thorarchaeota archaeon]